MKYKKVRSANEKTRKFTFQIFDFDEDDQLNSGELYLLFKYSYFFNSLVQNNIHLIKKVDLNFDMASQLGNFEMALLKEEFE